MPSGMPRVPTGDIRRITDGLERGYVGSAFYSPAQPGHLRFAEHSCVLVRWSMQRTRSALAGAWAEARVGAAEARLLAMFELEEGAVGG